MVKEIQKEDAEARLSQVVGKVPSLGWLLANSPLRKDDLPGRKPARGLRELMHHAIDETDFAD